MHEIIIYSKYEDVRKHVRKRIEEIVPFLPFGAVKISECDTIPGFEMMDMANEAAPFVKIIDKDGSSINLSTQNNYFCEEWYERVIICFIYDAVESHNQYSWKYQIELWKGRSKNEENKNKSLQKKFDALNSEKNTLEFDHDNLKALCDELETEANRLKEENEKLLTEIEELKYRKPININQRIVVDRELSRNVGSNRKRKNNRLVY